MTDDTDRRSGTAHAAANAIRRTYLVVEEGLALLGALLIVAMMLVTAIDVALRELFNNPLLGAFEVMEFMMAGVIFLGLAHLQRQGGHIALDFVVARMSPTMQRCFSLFGHLLALSVFLAISWRTGQTAFEAWTVGHHTSGGVRLPTWPGRSAVPIGTGLLCIRLMIDAVTDVKHLVRRGRMEQ